MYDYSYVRPYIEMLYTGKCKVYGDTYEKNEVGITRLKKRSLLLEDIPCQLSHSSNSTSTPRDFPDAEQGIKLFLAPEYDIPIGSEITVTQAGITQTFNCSSEPLKFFTHQEINLKLKR